mgnify:CR=1 FL=1
MTRVLVIRFGSLGDLCLLAWPLAGLAGRVAGRPHVTVAVKAAHAPLLAGAPGVDEVAALRGAGLAALRELAGELGRQRFDLVLDAHGVLRSHLLCLLLGRRPAARIAKDTAARLALLRARRRGTCGAAPPSAALGRTMLQRLDEVFAPLAVAAPGAALLQAGGAPLRPVPAAAAARPRRLGLVPGARWDAKRWPDAHWAALLRDFRARADAPVEIFVGEQERAWFPGGALARAAGELPDVTVSAGLPLPALAARLASCRVVVTNDSGLLHLSEAAGTPVLALFGPTVRAFGYFPLLPGSRVLEIALDCRPCSRNGRRPCWRRDLACLERIAPSDALAALLAMPAWRDAETPESSRA